MTGEPKPLVIIGTGEQGELACEYFTHDSPRSVAGFSVEAEFLASDTLMGRPVVPLEEIERHYPPAGYDAFVAVSSTQLNRVRTRLYRAVKDRGYDCASYVSSRAFIWHDVVVGENSFVFEHNVLQYKVEIGSNVILWSGNHVGHRTVIGDNTFVSSHVVISGFCDIGESCFLGVNSCFNDKVKVGHDCVIGSGAVVIKDLEPRGVYVGNPARPTGGDSFDAFGVERD